LTSLTGLLESRHSRPGGCHRRWCPSFVSDFSEDSRR